MEKRIEVAAAMADAAQAWLALLTAEQREIATGPGPGADEAADDERRRWFYTPTDHGGLTFHQQRPAQQQAAMRLVSTGLSRAGYVTVATTIGLENVLDHTEGFGSRFDRERGRDPGLYYLRVFGDPGSGTWGWRFGGHHVSLNNVVAGHALVATTPCFLGADPASSELLGGAVNRPLARVEDLGRELVRSLTPDLVRRAVLAAKAPADLVTANRTSIADGDRVVPLAGIWRGDRFADAAEQAKMLAASDRIEASTGYGEDDHQALEYTSRPKGIAGAELDAGQRDLLRALLGTYFGRVPDAVSPMASYDDAALDAVHFAWAGPTEPGAPHYYRVQGPRLLLEWDNTQRDANHAHSVWRDPANDFGFDALRAHRRHHHGGTAS
ncbi:DUF3500 domain-containing protein [Actinoplanes sp. DH11]|uniref:DUF3500 domain-containing protein n=1 Tax=Actinoplanes sp. DH11 TaxID=2857011 RepID=UPI001E36EBBE|nr:DUF3500 domain-containing protein [Actinoplanes sp. DH11]